MNRNNTHAANRDVLNTVLRTNNTTFSVDIIVRETPTGYTLGFCGHDALHINNPANVAKKIEDPLGTLPATETTVGTAIFSNGGDFVRFEPRTMTDGGTAGTSTSKQLASESITLAYTEVVEAERAIDQARYDLELDEERNASGTGAMDVVASLADKTHNPDPCVEEVTLHLTEKERNELDQSVFMYFLQKRDVGAVTVPLRDLMERLWDIDFDDQ